ncbi:hypothetical protein pb186bvf_012272 [Paramecium bursaria]
MNNLETLCQYINRQIDGQPKALVQYIEELCSQNANINLQYDPQKDCEICQQPNPTIPLPQCNHCVHSECIQGLIHRLPDNIFQEDNKGLIKCSPRCIGNINSKDFLIQFYGNTNYNNKIGLITKCEICQLPFPKNTLPQCNHCVHSECIEKLIHHEPDSVFQNNNSLLIKCSSRCIGNINSEEFLIKFYGNKNYHEKIEELTQRFIQQLGENDKKEQHKNQRKVQFTCRICFSQESVEEKGISLDCDHMFCQECIQEVIQNKINNGDFTEEKLVCPQQGCTTTIGINIIKNVCGQQAYEKVLEQRTNRVELIGNDHFVKCPYCSSSYSVPQELMTTFLMCKGCNKQFCPNGCQKPHQGMTCKQFQAKNAAPVNQDVKQCPKCQAPILKNEGCNHMTCTCEHEFCWLCLGPYKPKKLCTCKKNGVVDKIFGIFGF